MVTSSAVVGSSASSSFGRTGQRDGDHRPLPHAAGKLVRIFVEPAVGIGNADDGHQFERPLPPLPGVERLVGDQVFLDLHADRQDRVQGRHRLLENHRDLAATQPAEFFRGHGNEIAAAPVDTAAHVSRFADQPHDGTQRDALARAGFADEADDLARADVEIHVGSGNRQAARRVERGGQAAHDEAIIFARFFD